MVGEFFEKKIAKKKSNNNKKNTRTKINMTVK